MFTILATPYVRTRSITGADFTQDDAAARDLVRTYGVAKIVNTSFESLVKTTGDTRISTGVYATSTANVTVEGCAFKNLRYGVNVRDKAVVSVTDVTLEGCQDAFYMNSVVQVTADKIEVTEDGRLFVRNVAMVFDAYLGGGEGRFSQTV